VLYLWLCLSEGHCQEFTDGNCIVYNLTVPSGPPLKFSVVATTPRSLYFSWEPPRPEEQNGVIVGYVVNVTSNHSMEVLQLYSDLQETNVSVAGLKPYTVYVCAVAAITIPGVGPYSDEDTVLMPEDGKRFHYCIG